MNGTTRAPRIEFDMYGVQPPPGDWAYELDDFGVIYRRGLVAQRLRPGWWPFADASPEREQGARRGHRYPPIAPECGARSVRLSPGTEYRSWRNETVIVHPDMRVPHLAAAHLTLWVRAHGMGADVTYCNVAFDLKAGTFELGECIPEVKDQAESKAAKIAAFLAAAVAERDTSAREPATAYGRWAARVGCVMHAGYSSDSPAVRACQACAAHGKAYLTS